MDDPPADDAAANIKPRKQPERWVKKNVYKPPPIRVSAFQARILFNLIIFNNGSHTQRTTPRCRINAAEAYNENDAY